MAKTILTKVKYMARYIDNFDIVEEMNDIIKAYKKEIKSNKQLKLF